MAHQDDGELTKVVSIRLTPKLIRQLDRLANEAKRKRPDYIRVVLEEVVERGGIAVVTK